MGLIHKTNFYLKNKHGFNMLYLGDSTTRQNIDPEAMDGHLSGSHSYNLGWLMHWQPTQYVHFKDILPQIPKNTRVVWTIRHESFFVPAKEDDFRFCYPIKLRDVPAYLKMGYGWRQFGGNVFFHNFYEPFAPLVPGMALHTYRKWFYDRFEAWMNRRISLSNKPHLILRPAASPERPLQINRPKYMMIKKHFLEQEEVLDVGLMTHDEWITAAIITKRRGNQLLVELLPDFFRAEQRSAASGRAASDPVWDKRAWKLFTSIVELFEQNNIRLVINEFEYAPIYYRSAQRHAVYRKHMDRVRDYVKGRGIPYVRVDYNLLTDEDFYDLDHMNIRGVKKYNQLLSEAIVPYMDTRTRHDV